MTTEPLQPPFTRSQLTCASKFMSLVLRHQPQLIGLVLDREGWALIEDLMTGSQTSSQPLSPALIAEVVQHNDKQRFRLSEDGLRIRANQGHSVPVDLALSPLEPLITLFHGTADRFWSSIQRNGLQRRSRQHVHLSAEYATAIRVGQRHGVPIVLAVDAHALWEAGQRFYRSDNGVWLTDAVPPTFLHLLPPEAH